MDAPLEVDTKRLLLRGIPERESRVFHEIVGDPTVMAHWHPGADPDVAATRDRILAIQRHWREHGFGDWGVEENASGYLIGFSGLHYIDGMREVNLGYAFRRDAWRRGFGTEVCRKVLDVGLNTLGLGEIVAVISPANIASMRLAEKVGMAYWKKTTWSGLPRIVYRIAQLSI
jgi:[ribosomal protein S5]-alanine N-acetyltransferase